MHLHACTYRHYEHFSNVFKIQECYYLITCVWYFHQQIVSCAGDGMIHFTDLERESTYGQFQFDCHAGTTYEVYSESIAMRSLL